MHMKTIVNTALAAASLAGAAFAGTTPTIVPAPAPAPVKASADCPLSGKLSAGYATNYTYRGLVMSHSIVEGDSVIPVSLDLGYALTESDAILLGISYDTLISGHHLYGYDVDFDNELEVTLAYQKKLCQYVKGLSITGGYHLTDGGLAGTYAQYIEDESDPVTHELFVNINQEIAGGLYAGVTVSYSFAGVTGWWYEPYIGYKRDLCPRAAVDVKAGWTACSGYFSSNEIGQFFNANGSQAFFIRLSIDAKVTDHLSIVPFVSFNWLGNGAQKANKHFLDGYKPYKNFGVVAGASVVLNF